MLGKAYDGVHACEQFVAVFLIARALPFGEPVGGVAHPVGTYPQTCGSRTWIFVAGLGEAHGVECI